MIVISDSLVLRDDAKHPRIYWRNIITRENITSDEAAADEPVDNLANPTTYLAWRGTTTGEQAITISLGAAEEVNYWAIARHNLGSTGASAQLQGSVDGSTWEDVGSEITPTNDRVLVHEFVDAFFAHYRLVITPGDAPPRISVLYVGKSLILPRRIYVGHTPVTMGQRTMVSTGRSENGQFLGRVVRREFLETQVKQENIYPAWYRANMLDFQEAAKALPFFFSWRPAQYPDEVAYCWLRDDISVSNARPNGMMTFEMSLQGIR